MTERTFASWVEPIAAKHREDSAQVLEFARSLPDDAWSRPSPLEGWTYKDMLAHLTPTEDLRMVLRAVLANERIDPAIFTDSETRNARQIEERRYCSVDELIAELEAWTEETQELLARLTKEHEGRRQANIPMTLGEGLRAFPSHDQGHLVQLRTALEES